MYVCMSVCIYIYVYIYTHTYIHTDSNKSTSKNQITGIEELLTKFSDKVTPLLYSSRPDDVSENTQSNPIEDKVVQEKQTIDDNSNVFGSKWWPTTAAKDVDEDEDNFESWWPTTTNNVQEDDFESWWPTNPVVIDSLEAKSPSKTSVIDWSFLDTEYPDPIDNEKIEIEETSTNIGLLENLPLIGISTSPRHSTSNIDEIQINKIKKTNIEVEKVPSRRGSLSMIEMIKEMTGYLYSIIMIIMYYDF